jgi:hypothetical protein
VTAAAAEAEEEETEEKEASASPHTSYHFSSVISERRREKEKGASTCNGKEVDAANLATRSKEELHSGREPHRDF